MSAPAVETPESGGGLRGAVRNTRLFPYAKSFQERVSPSRRAARRSRVAFYREFVGPGRLVFDVGANMGNRSEVFLELGARVVAVEPQPLCAATLACRFGRDQNFTVLRTALGRKSGTAKLHLSSNHVLASMSREFIDRSDYAGASWPAEIDVRVATLDSLIAVFGLPDFCKIDVEGFEHEVLHGLSHAVPAVSLEFNPAMREIAVECLERLGSLGRYRFAFSPGESMRPAREWFGHDEAVAMARDTDQPWGDFYARLTDRAGTTP